MASTAYTTKALKLGVEVFGIDLKEPIRRDVVEAIKADVSKHRIMVFRNQGIVPPERQIEISEWFGPIDCDAFYKHPKSPSDKIFRVSNCESEGCLGVGRTGWHIDGTFRQCPYSYSIYHMINVPHKGGDTRFIGLTELIGVIPKDISQKFNKLYMMSDKKSARQHPLIYRHPITANPTMCFHCGMIDAFKMEGTSSVTTQEETKSILQSISDLIRKHENNLVYDHKWLPGDFLITDNLAVAHEASPSTQLPVEQIGLRVMHRTTIKGIYEPRK